MHTQPRAWYRIENKAEQPSVADVHIYDQIGKSFWDDTGISAKQFIDDLNALPAAVETINVHVNSPGGNVFEALAITNALRAQATEKKRAVEMSIEGLAGSAASFVIMAGTKIRIADNALVMIHDPRGFAMGTAQEMLATAAALEKIKDSIVATYRWQSSLTPEALSALMTAETWMSAQEAIANGFAHEQVQGLKAAALIDPRAIEALQVPEQYRARVQAFVQKPAPPQTADPKDVARLCKEADCLDLVESLLGLSLEDVQAKVTTAKSERLVVAQRRTDITALCTTAKLPELAAGYIAGAMSLDAVRAHLTTITAKLDQFEIDGSLRPAGGTKAKSAINITEIYAARNGRTKE